MLPLPEAALYAGVTGNFESPNFGKCLTSQTKSPSQIPEMAIKVIRLGFAKVRCFTGGSGALLVLLDLVNGLIYNVISVFLAV